MHTVHMRALCTAQGVKWTTRQTERQTFLPGKACSENQGGYGGRATAAAGDAGAEGAVGAAAAAAAQGVKRTTVVANGLQ